MFERFTDRARRVMVLAQEEARLLNHGFIGTEHLLLGLVSESEGVAAQVLSDMGVGLDLLRATFTPAPITQAGAEPQSGTSPPFTPRAKRVFESALRESLQLGHNYIGTEHMLLGLVREGEGVGIQVLGEHFGLSPDAVRAAVIEKLREYGSLRPDQKPTDGYETEAADTLPDSQRRVVTVSIPLSLFNRLNAHALAEERSVEGTIRYAVRRLLQG